MFDSRAETNEKNCEQTEVQNSKVSNGKYSRFLLVLLFFRLPRQKSLYILKYDGNFQQFNQLIYSEKKRDDWESLNTFMCLYEWQIFDMRVFFVCALHLYSIANLFVWFCIFDGVFFSSKRVWISSYLQQRIKSLDQMKSHCLSLFLIVRIPFCSCLCYLIFFTSPHLTYFCSIRKICFPSHCFCPHQFSSLITEIEFGNLN